MVSKILLDNGITVEFDTSNPEFITKFFNANSLLHEIMHEYAKLLKEKNIRKEAIEIATDKDIRAIYSNLFNVEITEDVINGSMLAISEKTGKPIWHTLRNIVSEELRKEYAPQAK
mgnify:CR=1 FL=1